MSTLTQEQMLSALQVAKSNPYCYKYWACVRAADTTELEILHWSLLRPDHLEHYLYVPWIDTWALIEAPYTARSLTVKLCADRISEYFAGQHYELFAAKFGTKLDKEHIREPVESAQRSLLKKVLDWR